MGPSFFRAASLTIPHKKLQTFKAMFPQQTLEQHECWFKHFLQFKTHFEWTYFVFSTISCVLCDCFCLQILLLHFLSNKNKHLSTSFFLLYRSKDGLADVWYTQLNNRERNCYRNYTSIYKVFCIFRHKSDERSQKTFVFAIFDRKSILLLSFFIQTYRQTLILTIWMFLN